MTATCQTRQHLIEQCQDLVRSLAAKIHRNLPPYLELEDLIAYGQVGLAEAARDFDPSRGTQFSTYAYYRIRGEIYDGLSKMTWLSRAEYRKVRYEEMAAEVLRMDAEEADTPSDQGTEAEIRWFRDISRALAVVYLATHTDDPKDRKPESLEDPAAPTPAAAAMGRELRQKLGELIDDLPRQARTLVKAVYFEEMTLQEAGRKLGISKSWASRLHAKSLQRLARSLRLLGVAP